MRESSGVKQTPAQPLFVLAPALAEVSEVVERVEFFLHLVVE